MKPPRVLFVRVGALGDLLVSLRALEETIQRFPESHITIVGPSLWREILRPEMWPHVDQIFDVKTRELFSSEKNITSHLHDTWVSTGTTSYWKLCREAHAVVNLRIESLRYSWAPFFTRVPMRIGSAPSVWSWLYTEAYPWLGKEPPIHERDWYSQVAQGQKPQLNAMVKDGLPLLKKMDSKILEKYDLQSKQYVLINPTASRKEKAWPQENFRQLLANWSFAEKPILLGAPHETDWLKGIAEEQCSILQPQNFSELMDVIAGARLLVANTSSLQFMAASLKTPAVVLMGLADPLRWGPLGPKDLVVRKWQGPLPQNQLFEKELEAYKMISVAEVSDAIHQALQS